MRMGAPQPMHSRCGRGVAGLIGLIGCLNTRNRNSAISRLPFGCQKPKLRALQKPLGSTCCMSSLKKVAPQRCRHSAGKFWQVWIYPDFADTFMMGKTKG